MRRRGGAGAARLRGACALAAGLAALALGAGVAEAKRAVFGVVPQDGALPSAKDLDRMPSGGISSLRMILHWSSIERERGTYDWGSTDHTVRETTRAGIEPLFFLYGTPQWAARNDGHRCRGDGCSVYAPSSPATRRAFARFAAAAVERYGPHGDFWRAPTAPACATACATSDPSPPPPPGEPPCGCTVAHPIRAWQIWNEQNSRKYFAPRVDARRYASMLRGAGAAIKRVDPGAEVILGGMWGPGSAKRVVTPVKTYLRDLYRVKGIRSTFDSIALHPYAATFAGALAAVKLARQALGRVRDGHAGTWITEIGWAAGGPAKNPYVKGKRGQARLLSRTLSELRRKRRTFRLRGVFWYSWRDKRGGDAICEWCGNAGLRAKSGSAKPAWSAFAKVTRR